MTVYVYNSGRADIADGLSEPVLAHFAQVKSDVVKGGAWLSVTKLQDGEEISVGDGPSAAKMLHASFKLGTESGDALSDLYLTGDRGNFFKIRCTYQVTARKECEEERAKLLKALGAALRASNAP